MKYKIGFKLDWLEMIFILIMVFFAGIFVTSQIDSKYIFVGLLIAGVSAILRQKMVKMPSRDHKTE